MDKNNFVQIYNKLITKNDISVKDGAEIIIEYCKINNKDESKTQTFIKALIGIPSLFQELIGIPSLFQECLTISLQELSKHFNVNTLTEIKTNKILKVF